MARLYADNIATTLAAGISASDTTLTVADATGMPSPTGGDFAILTLIEGTTTEKVTLTARSGTTLTVTRGAEGSTPAVFTSAARVILAATASSFAVPGAPTQVLFNSAGDLAGDAGLTYDAATNVLTNTGGQLVLTGGTRTTSAPLIDATQTWNAAGTPFTGVRLNVTNTASSAASKILDLQVNGSSAFFVRTDGAMVTPTGLGPFAFSSPILSNYSFILGNGNVTGVMSSGLLGTYIGSGFALSDKGNYLEMAQAYALGWSANPGGGHSGGVQIGDLYIRRDAADTLAQRRDTNPQTFRVYNTWSSSGTNFERTRLSWVSNVFLFGTEKAGTGAARPMELQTDGTTALTLTTAQKAEFAQTIKTAAPAGGTAAEWKLGTVATVSPTSPNRTIEVEIGGTTYYLAAKTTND
jgi:hypothetical protein